MVSRFTREQRESGRRVKSQRSSVRAESYLSKLASINHLGAGVGLLVRFLDSLFGHMGVNLGS